ncbi:hypothetical protein ACET3Z_004568 [Daucus carota]
MARYQDIGEQSLDARGEGATQEWGSWLRAPPRRGVVQGGSKWLREEDDVGWAERVGRGNNCPIFPGGKSGGQDRGGSLGRDSRSTGGESSKHPLLRITQGGNLNENGPNTFIQITNGLFEEEDDGMDLEERKRKRIGPITKGPMDTDDILLGGEIGNKPVQLKEAVFSEADYTISRKHDLATLAVQASHPL